jgi:hypothetical protein
MHNIAVAAVASVVQHMQAVIRHGIDADLDAVHAGYNAVTSQAAAAISARRAGS